jgi:hypothetical protein
VSDNLLKYLEYEARVKPEIKALVDNLDNMSYDDIEKCKVPLPWFKKALSILKAQNDAKKQGLAAPGIRYGTNPDPLGQTAYWHYDPKFIKTATAMEVEITTGTLVWFPADGGVWIESVFCKTVEPQMDSLVKLETCTKSEYMRKYKEATLKRVDGPTLPTTSYTSPQIEAEKNTLSAWGVRIYR